ncbi:N-acetylglucosamine-6-phosphate deacetylase [Halalkalibacter krulwichiae]|uniref:N-acetylglucosamine-6-phosphate deacetylase n=1 Tax=Halalkalibacter krulwichiae TaxID=199441 RepID=A0A1X9MJD1_9BACI|nr:N-acetylglucosamine-6-phosphate deacetylase [Halalkalibacter krulwichiae]ARK32403.1 N-acetylglucosamine-6-phosphate deacetylase [Halalkalibacter krulwichiae]
MSKTIVLTNGNIYSQQGYIENGYIKVKNGKIIDVCSMSNYQFEKSSDVIDLQGKTVIPGMIDLHIHGAAGADVMDANPDALEAMTIALSMEGVTSFLATTMTQSDEAISAALRNVASFLKEPSKRGRSEILGVHLEGPFINPNKAGAQPSQHIKLPEIPLFQKWQDLAEGAIKVVTMAPEQGEGMGLVRFLKQSGIVVSIGHSDASFAEVEEAVEAGATQVTHLYNQMKGLHHREPGVVGAAFLLDELYAEMIVDGIHVSPEMVDLAYRQKKAEKIILISDAIRAKCLKNGMYDLGGQQVIVEGGKAMLADGTLAGSVLKLKDAAKNMLSYAKDCSLVDVIQMASVNPAKQAGVYDRKGSLVAGKDADIVVLNDELDVEMTFCLGELAYQREGTVLNGAN